MPDFAAGNAPEFSPLSSSGMVELHEQSTLGEVTGGLWPEATPGVNSQQSAPGMSGGEIASEEADVEGEPAAEAEESAD